MVRASRALEAVLVPVGALLAGASFFLPYVHLLRVFGTSLTLTGPRIGRALWLVPAMAVVILLVQLAVRRSGLRRVLVVGAAALGLLVVFGVLARLHQRGGMLFVHYSAATFGVRPAVGWAGSLLGFVLTLLGALLWSAMPGVRGLAGDRPQDVA